MQFLLVESGAIAHFERWSPHSDPHPPQGTAFLCVPARSRLRTGCHRVVRHRTTMGHWYFFVTLSTLLAFVIQPRYLYPRSVDITLFSLQCLCLAFFWIRMLVEIVASGVILNRGAFLRSFWNLAEVTVNVFAILQIIPQTNHHRWMRSFAALRPVRFLALAPVFTPLTAPLWRGFPYLFDVALSFIFMVSWMAIIGVLSGRNKMAQRCFATTVAGAGATSDANSSLLVVLRNVTSKCGVGRSCPNLAGHNVSASGLIAGQSVCRSSPSTVPADARDMYYQFKNIGASLLMVLQVVMVDNWYQVLEDVMSVLGSAAALYPVVIASIGFFLTSTVWAIIWRYYADSAAQESSPTSGDLSGAQAGSSAKHARLLPVWGPPEASAARGLPGGKPRESSAPMDVAAPSRTSVPSTRRDIAVQTAADHRGNVGAAVSPGPVRAGISSPLLAASGRGGAGYTAPRSSGQTGGPAARLDAWQPLKLVDQLERESFPTWVRSGTPEVGFLGTTSNMGLLHALGCLEITTKVDAGYALKMSSTRLELAQAVSSTALSLFLELLSLTTVVLLCVYHADMRARAALNLMRATAALAIFFLVPIVLRLSALGPRAVFSDAWTYVDVCAAVAGILEFAAPSIFDHYPVVCGLLRAVRGVHFLKYVLPSIALRRRLPHLGLWLIVSACTIALLSLLGMQLFSVSYVPDTTSPPRAELAGGFDTIWMALLATFTAFTGANVSSKLVNIFVGGTIPIGALFFLALAVLSFWVLGPLLLAILTEGFLESLTDEMKANAFIDSAPPPLLLPALELPQKADNSFLSTLDGAPARGDDVEDDSQPKRTRVADPGGSCAPPPPPLLARHPPPTPVLAATLDWAFRDTFIGAGLYQLLHARFSSFVSLCELFCERRLVVDGDPLCGGVASTSGVRRFLLAVLGSIFYRVAAMLCLVMGFVALFFERRTLPAAVNGKLHKVNIAYVVILWLDMVIKWLAYGLVRTTRVDRLYGEVTSPDLGAATLVSAYLCEPLHIMDLCGNSLAFGGLFYAPMRVGRVLHTLRFLSTPESPNSDFNLLMATLVAGTAKVLPFVLAAYALFAVLGVQLFAGQMHVCSDPSITHQDLCVGTFAVTRPTFTGTEAVLEARSWAHTAFRYDQFGHALLSVFVTSTANNWTTLMQEAMSVPLPRLENVAGADASVRDAAKSAALAYNHSGYSVIYFVAIILLLRFVALRSVTASLAAHFTVAFDATQEELLPPPLNYGVDASAPDWRNPPGSYMTSSRCSRQNADCNSAILRSPGSHKCGGQAAFGYAAGTVDLFEPLNNRVSRTLHSVLAYRAACRGRPVMDYSVAAFVVVHTVFMAARHTGATGWESSMFNILDYIGLGVYGAEALVRLIAYGHRHLFQRVRYLLDLVVLAFLIVAVAAPDIVGFFRSFVILKLPFLIAVDMTWRTCCLRWGCTLNAVGIYFFVVFAYAAAGVLLFGNVAPEALGRPPNSASGSGPVLPAPPLGLSQKRNFSTLIGSLLVLFNCSTGDNWHLTMLSCARSPGSPGVHAAVVYFVTFVSLVNLICVPLIVATVMGTFARPPASRLLVRLRAAREAWARNFGQWCTEVGMNVFADAFASFPLSITGAVQLAPGGAPSREEALAWFLLTHLTYTRELRGDYQLRYEEFVRGLIRAAWGDARILSDNHHHSTASAHAAGTSPPDQFRPLAVEAVARSSSAQEIAAPPPLATSAAATARSARPVQFHYEADPNMSPDRAEPDECSLHLKSGDVSVPNGALPIPRSNLFLYGLYDSDYDGDSEDGDDDKTGSHGSVGSRDSDE